MRPFGTDAKKTVAAVTTDDAAKLASKVYVTGEKKGGPTERRFRPPAAATTS